MGMETLAVAGGVALGGLSGFLSGKSSLKAAKANAQASAISSAAEASNLRMQGATQAANAAIQEANYDSQADYYLRQANNFFLSGRDEKESRGVELGQDKGNILASAAGSGISADSRVVQKTTEDTVKSAYRDMEIMSNNEYQNIYGAMSGAKTARVNADNARAIGEWANSAYSSLASDTERYGAITARNIVKSGYDNAVYSTIGGLVSGLGTGISWAN